jgi:F0F1-type ATP synthase delta subunit
MEKLYAQALWKSIENGKSPKEAVESLAKLLKKQGRVELMPRIGKAFKRLAEASQGNRVRIFVAHEKDSKHALKASGLEEADVCVDETLIGGWRLEGGNEVVDRSFKKYLLDIYTSSIAA